MAINKKLVNFKKKEDYTKQKEEGNILDSTIVFIDDAKEIVTHNTVFDGSTPDWETLKNRPFGDFSEETIVYENNTLTFKDNRDDYKITYGDEFEIVVGETYKVIVDGVVYDNLVCKKVGNDKAITDSSENTPFPSDGNFYIYQSEFTPNISIKTDKDSVDIAIYHCAIDIRKIDEKYLPEMQTAVSADWLAKEGEEGYIKNSPLNTGYSVLGSIEGSFGTSGSYKNLQGSVTVSDVIEDGGQYVVSIDVKKYSCIGVQNPVSKYLCLTNGKIDDETGNPMQLLDPQEGEFIISFSPGSKGGSMYIYDTQGNFNTDVKHTIEIKKVSNLVIDYKYLPFGDRTALFYENTNVTVTSTNGNAYGALNFKFNDTYDTGCTYTIVINDKTYENIAPNPSNNGHISDDYTGSIAPLYANSNFILMTGNGSLNGSMYFKEPIVNGTVIIYKVKVEKIAQRFLPSETVFNGINVNGNYYTKDSDNLVRLPSFTTSVTVNGTNYPVNGLGKVDLGDIVNSVTVNGEKKTGDIDLGDIVTLTFDGDLTFDSTKYSNLGSSTYGKVTGESVLSLGDKYLVIYEGEKYFLEVKASRDMNNSLFYYLSPKELTNKTYPNQNLSSDNPFVICYNLEGIYEEQFECYYIRANMFETKTVSSYKLNSDKSVVPTSNLPIVQETGESETQIMSQKAVTDALVKLWKGSEEEYNALGSYDDNTIYVII